MTTHSVGPDGEYNPDNRNKVERRSAAQAMRPPDPQARRDFHRAAAACLAIALRFLADMAAARALPPMRPSATAAAFLPSSVVMSSTSPVAILAIMTARALTSAGRFSPLGPRGIGR